MKDEEKQSTAQGPVRPRWFGIIPKPFTLLDRFILGKFISTFVFMCILFAVIACVIDYSEKVGDFVEKKAPLLAILNYFKNFAPHIVALLYPLFIFISTIFFTSKMAYKSEIISMLAAGVSFHRFLRPYWIGGILMGLIFLLGNHWLIPMANRQRLDFEDRYVKNRITQSDEQVHLQLSPTLLVYLERYSYISQTGDRFTAETIDGTLLKEKVWATRVSYDSSRKRWTLYDVTIRKNDSLKEELVRLPQLEKIYPFTPRDLKRDNDIQMAMTTPQLNQFIKRQKMHGNESLNGYYVDKYKRTAQPFAGLILVLIAGILASRKVRGGSGFHIVIGIGMSVIYLMALQFSTTFSTKAGFNPLLAVWIPNLIFAVVAAVMYRREVS